MQRGRKGRDSQLTVIPSDATGTSPPPNPLQPLQPDERRIYDHIFREFGHLQVRDTAMVMGFARASAGLLRVETAAEFNALARMQLSYARALRLSVQSRVDPKTLARRMAEQDTGPRPWDRHEDQNEDGER